MKARLASLILKVLLPNKACLLCRQHSATLVCDYCYQDLHLFDLHSCDHNLMNLVQVQRGLAGRKFDTLVSLSDYQPPLSNLIRGLKYAKRFTHARALAELFVDNALDGYGQDSIPQVILPVPLHARRYVERKYNQSIELARHISALTQIPLDCTWLSRTKNTLSQAGLQASQRQQNIQQAFVINGHRPYQHVVVLDDVVTTGATVQAISNLIKSRQSNIRVDIWSVCLTLFHPQSQT